MMHGAATAVLHKLPASMIAWVQQSPVDRARGENNFRHKGELPLKYTCG